MGHNNTILVDKMIGNAYDTVKHVAQNVEYVKHISAHLEEIYRVHGSLDSIEGILAKMTQLDGIYTNLASLLDVLDMDTRLAFLESARTEVLAAASTAQNSATSAQNAANSFKLNPGAVTTLPAGSSAAIAVNGSGPAYTLDFSVPRGDSGPLASGIVLPLAVTGQAEAVTSGENKFVLRTPYAFEVTSVRASLVTPTSSGSVTVDINKNGVSILSPNKLTIDAGTKTSLGSVVLPTLSNAVFGDDDELSIDVDAAGTGGAGLRVTLYGNFKPANPIVTLTPSTVTAVSAWWDGTDDSTLTLDGNDVSVWASKVGGISATQAGIAKPTRQTAQTPNGSNALYFGTTDLMTVAPNALINDLFHGGGYVLLAAKWNSPGGGGLGRLIDKVVPQILYLSGGGVRYADSHLTAVVDVGNTALGNNGWFIYEIWFDRDTSTSVINVRINGIQTNMTVAWPGGARTSDAANPLVLGNRAAGDRGLDGWLAHAIFCQNIPPQQQRDGLKNWVAADLGVTVV